MQKELKKFNFNIGKCGRHGKEHQLSLRKNKTFCKIFVVCLYLRVRMVITCYKGYPNVNIALNIFCLNCSEYSNFFLYFSYFRDIRIKKCNVP